MVNRFPVSQLPIFSAIRILFESLETYSMLDQQADCLEEIFVGLHIQEVLVQYAKGQATLIKSYSLCPFRENKSTFPGIEPELFVQFLVDRTCKLSVSGMAKPEPF